MKKTSTTGMKRGLCTTGFCRAGFLFSIDALIASVLIISGLVIIASMQYYTTDVQQVRSSGQDIMQSMSSMRVDELKDPWVLARLNNNTINGSISDGSVSVLDQIGEYWAAGDLDSATTLSQIFLASTNQDYGLNLSIDGTQIYYRNTTKNSENSIVSSRMITGIAKGKAITGSSSSAYLRYIKNKHNSMFVPFGGFVGEGNISVLVDPLPSDANVTDLILSFDTEQKFYLDVNWNQCDYLTPNSSPLVPTVWSRANCSRFVNSGSTNVFTFRFDGPINMSSINGGFLKIVYLTNKMNELNAMNSSSAIYRFPQIYGIVNLYDGFSVPGTINSMNMTLVFNSTYDTYLTIGNSSFKFSGSNASQNITINDTQIQSALADAGLTYSDISDATVPLRFGIGNVVINGNPAQVMVVTDTSGSMAWCIKTDDDPPCPVGDMTKISSAKNVTTGFVSSLLNGTSGMQVGLAEFSDDIKSGTNLTTNLTRLVNQINGYSTTGGTCICCGINNATDTLIQDGQLLLVQRGSSGWKYNDTKMASPPASWNLLSFNDSRWKNGTTNIGWGYAGQSTTISNQYQGDYYFRKSFTISNLSQIVETRLYVFEDDGADVYINGVRVDNNYGSTINNGLYWNRNEILVNKSILVSGQNVIAVRMYHRSSPNRTGFDLSFIANTKGNATSNQRKNIVIMTDGEANAECARQNTGDATQDAIKAACDAYSNYGIIVYTVGFGIGADNATLNAIANCTTGQYFSAKNDTALRKAFEAIGNTIIQSSSTQTAVATGNVSTTSLSYLSVIYANYTPDVEPPKPNEISVTMQTPPLQSCSATVPLYPGMRLLSAKVYSYSGDYWTSRVVVNNVTVYNLSKYSSIYSSIGDPYQISIPASLLSTGNNTIGVSIGIEGNNDSANCSSSNIFVYTAGIDLSTERSPVVANYSGCKWSVQFDGQGIINMSIPSFYTGSNLCQYTQSSVFDVATNTTVYSPNVSLDRNDSYQLGAYSIFSRLDFKKDGSLFVDLNSDDMEVIVTTISKVPYLWGPSVASLEVTR